MSESEPTEKPSDATPDPKPESKPKAKVKGKWRRRLWRTFLVIVALFIAFRIALQFLLPSVLHRTARAYGLDLRYERHEMDLFGGDVGLWHLTLAPAEGGPQLVAVDYCRADISTLDLLRRRLVVRRIEAEGMDLTVEREANGDIPILKRFMTADATTNPAAPTASTQPTDINLTSPFQLDLFRVDRVHTHLIDRSVTPPLDTSVDLNVRLTDLRSPVRNSKFDLDLSARPVLESMRITGHGHAAGKILDAETEVVITGLHPAIATAYLAPLGIKPVASDLSMTFHGTVVTGPCARPGGLAASARLDGISLRADGQVVAGLDKVSIDAAAVGPQFAEVTRVLVEGGVASAERSPAGAIRIAGIELAPTTQKSPSSPSRFRADLASTELKGIKASFIDNAISPSARIAMTLDDLLLKNLTNAAGQPGAKPLELTLALRIPGIARTIKIEGSADESTGSEAVQSAQFTFKLDGLKPDALKPYLDAAGVDCLLKDGSVTCTIRAAVKPDGVIDAQLQNVKYADDGDLLGFDDVHVAGLSLAGDRVRVGQVDISGPALGIRRNADGTLETLGFRTRLPGSSAPAKSTTQPSAMPTTAPSMAALPKIQIDHLTWQGIHIKYEDQFVSPATSVNLQDAGVEIESLKLDSTPTTQPARIRAWMKAPGLAGNLNVLGTLQSARDISTAELDITGDGLTAEPIRTYLKAAGIEPVLRDATLKAHIQAQLKPSTDGSGMIFSGVNLANVQLKQGTGDELAGLNSLSIAGLDLQPGSNSIATINVDRPRIHLTREKDNTFTVAGFHTLPTTAPAAVGGSPLTMGVQGATTSTKPATQPASSIVTLLKSLKLNGAELHWTDRAAPKPVDLKAVVTANIQQFEFGKPQPAPAKIDLTVHADGVLDQLAISGTVSPSPDSPAAKLNIEGRGIQAGTLAAYLPPTITSTLKDGRLKLVLDAALASNAKGGQQAHVLVSGLDFRDGENGPPLLGFDSLAFRLNRFDPAAKLVAIDELSLSGVETSVRTAPGGLTLLGIQTKPSLQPAQPASKPVAGAMQIRAAPPATQPANAANLAQAVAGLRLEFPLVTIEKLNLGVKRLSLINASRPNAAPFVISDLDLKNHNRIELLGSDSEDRPPSEFELNCRPSPLADLLKLDAKIAPFAQRPSALIHIDASGIQGAQLLSAFPELAQQIDGSHLTGGSVKVAIKAEMKIDRRDLMRLDFSRPFDIDLAVNDLEYRSDPTGPVLAGLQELRTEGVHIDPATGGAHAKLVELNKFSGRVTREKDGIHAMGLVLKTSPSPATQPTTQAVASKPSTAAAPTTRPAGEVRIDSLVISGMDFQLEDRTVDPPLLVPITSLDLEVRDLTNYLLFDADKSMRFSLLVNSGKVTLPRTAKKTEVAATTEPTNSPTTAPTDQRELFSQLTASGKLSLYPAPRGWVKTSLSGLEIAALKGEARAAGFDASAGTFDADIDARFLDSGALDLRPKFVFIDLGLKDSEQGSIAKAIGLPISLDGTITLLQDASGQISLPLHVVVENGKVNTGSVIASACGAVVGVVATAAASAPLKGIEGIGSLAGIKFGKKKPPPGPITIAFDHGGTIPHPADSARDAILPPQVLDRLRKDKTLRITVRHEMGAGDVKRIGELVNPPGEDAWALVYRLRLERASLLKERAHLAGQARGELGSGLDAANVLERLRGLDRELASTEDALDDLNELVRPGAGRQAVRRTRAACLALGNSRLIAVRDALIASGFPDAANRLDVTKATFDPNDELDAGRVTLTFKVAAKRQ